ncbi:UDP-N-acetylglucosamine 2-epimerase [Aminivibrio sp.]
MRRKRIAVVTGTRAEYGLLYWVLREIENDQDLDLQLIVTGSHLSPEFGNTILEIKKDGLPISWKVEMLLSGDSASAVTKSLGLAILGFADALEHLKPDMLLLLGDRYEIFGAASAALLAGIPIAHIHGGEVTRGAWDDSLRHGITKMASLHFVAHETYRKRVIQMGESPDTVFVVGPSCLDSLRNLTLPGKEELEEDMGISLNSPLLLITCHSETLSSLTGEEQIDRLLKALQRFPSAAMVFTGANADRDGQVINKKIKAFCAEDPRKRAFSLSLGMKRYWGMLSLANAVVGNSSSGMFEAPLFNVPVVNIGRRQEGRIRDMLVQDCTFEEEPIVRTIEAALLKVRPAEKKTLQEFQSPAELMVELLKTAPFETPKGFFDLPGGEI